MNWLTNTVGSGAGDLYYWLGGGSNAQSQINQENAQLSALNAQDYAPGGQIYTQIANTQGTAAANATWNQVQQNQAGQNLNVQTQLQQAGQAGAAKGLSSLSSGIQNVTSGIFGTVFKLIPWQAWVGAAILGLWYLGAFKRLKGKLA